jgi:hypothetical protein
MFAELGLGTLAAILGTVQLAVAIAALARPAAGARPAAACGLAGAALALWCWTSDAPLRARVRLSEPALTEYAEAVRQAPAPAPARGSAGLFRFRAVHGADGGVYLITGDKFKAPCGLAYLPDGPPPDQPAKPVFGPWYTFHSEVVLLRASQRRPGAQ